MLVGSVFVIRLLACLLFCDILQLFRVGDGSGDHVSAARPLTQVNQPAAVAAEGKVLLAGQHQSPASRTAQRTSLLPGHTIPDLLVSLRGGAGLKACGSR